MILYILDLLKNQNSVVYIFDKELYIPYHHPPQYCIIYSLFIIEIYLIFLKKFKNNFLYLSIYSLFSTSNLTYFKGSYNPLEF